MNIFIIGWHFTGDLGELLQVAATNKQILNFKVSMWETTFCLSTVLSENYTVTRGSLPFLPIGFFMGSSLDELPLRFPIILNSFYLKALPGSTHLVQYAYRRSRRPKPVSFQAVIINNRQFRVSCEKLSF